MSIHDQIMQNAAAPMLVEQLGDPEALLVDDLRPESFKLDAIVTHEQSTQDYDEQTREFTERITRQAHVPVSELERLKLDEIPNRTRVWVAGVAYRAVSSRLTGAFQTIELRRTELVRQNTGESPGGA